MNQPMPDLRTLQEQFFKSVAGDDSAQLLSLIKPSNISESTRLKIYKNTSFENLYNALKITFPGVWKLVGEECARGVSYAFAKDMTNLPTSGYIDDWGKDFPKFLSTISELSDLKYLEDYASFEWLQHLSFCATDAKIFDSAELQKVPSDQIGNVEFSFHPSVFFLRSEYPLDQIYDLLENPATAITKINLNTGPTYTIINRVDNHTNMLWVRQDYFDFILLLSLGKNLGDAIAKMQTVKPEFEFAQSLGFVLNKGLLASITIPQGK